MKLLHVHDFFAPGNSRHGFDLDRLLAARGHSVHVLAAVGALGPPDGTVLEEVRFHTYPFQEGLTGWRRYRWALRAGRERFEALHREHRFDLLVLNQPVCARGILSASASRAVARVYSFISPWAAEWEAAHPESGWLARRVQGGLRNRLEGEALAACHAVLVESAFVRGLLRERHPAVPESRVTLVPGAVDPARFRPDGPSCGSRARFGLGPGPVVLTVRRLVPRMGIDLLVRAAAALPGVELVVGGEGPLRGELEALAGSLGVRARFLGYVPETDLPALYRAADVVVLPTRALEGFGLVAIEAMACGTPALGTPVGALPEVLGPLGLLVEAPTSEAIAEGLRRFLAGRDPDLGRRCREHVLERYDWNRSIPVVEELFERVIRESAGDRRE
jgi:glycosyltransferase involved in cell wall biosynthesis